MKKFTSYIALALLIPLSVLAQGPTIDSLLDDIASLFESIIPILLTLAILTFFWGLVKFINHAGDQKAVEEGRQIMLWGMIAIFVMVALWSIIGYMQSELGLDFNTNLGTLPAPPEEIPAP
jgi:membrane protease YdiL (CAAX protease family)